MADNDDLTGLFPDPPPPDGDRRSKAIEAALRRFDQAHAQPDGDDGAMPPSIPAAPNRAKFAVLASAALVVLVTVTLLMSERFGPNATLQGPQPSAVERSVSVDLAEAQPSDPPLAAAAPAEAPPPPAFDIAPSDAAAPAHAMIAPPMVVPLAETRADAAAPQAAKAAPEETQPAAPQSAPARASMREGRAESADALVVTGSRASLSGTVQTVRNRPLAATRRQIRAWQECTVADERRNARSCAAQVRAAPGAAEIARGLTLSFRGEDTDASKAFDRALAAAPGSTTALLNRALIRQRLGDLGGAEADFDQAIRSNPGDARSYYFRSLLLRRRGYGDSADADLQKALDLASEEARKR